MPELPEVETTLRGIAPHVLAQPIVDVIVRNRSLRWPIAQDIRKKLLNHAVVTLDRRGKYLLLHLTDGILIVHLGMSGRLSIVDKNMLPQKHDHVDIIFNHQKILRFTDPRRFGAFLWTNDLENHFLLNHLGKEPLTDEFSGQYLYATSRNRKLPIKTFIMNQKIVVGVGNIYANEALFLAGIHPEQSASNINLLQYENLVSHIKNILQRAIEQGGTTLKDFFNSEGKPGYFSQNLHVYGRESEPCVHCHTVLVAIQINKRQTVFCPRCQG